MPETLIASAAPAFIRRAGLEILPEPTLAIHKVQLFVGEPWTRLERAIGATLPQQRRQVRRADVTVAWLAPGEWLVTGFAAERLEAALAGQVGLITDLTHASFACLLSGADARTALARHCPLDLSEAAFPIDAVARSLLGEASLFVGRLPDASCDPNFRIIVDQTMATYALRRLAPEAG